MFKKLVQTALGKLGYRLVPLSFLCDVDNLRAEAAQVAAEHAQLVTDRDGYKTAYEQTSREAGEARRDMAGYKNALDQALRDLGGYRAAFEQMRRDLAAAEAAEAARAGTPLRAAA